MSEFFGKYRGQVTNNVDPEMRGRIQVQVPAVLGEGRNSWALPATPYGGDGVGFFAIPPIGANVWVEFEGGNPGHQTSKTFAERVCGGFFIVCEKTAGVSP